MILTKFKLGSFANRIARYAGMALAVAGLISSSAALAENTERTRQDAFVRERLIDTVLLFDRHFRVPETGQYLDFVRIGKTDHTGVPSSIAATGIGLVSLAVGDALGVIDNAEEKAVKTLLNLLNRDKTSGFKIDRSPSGWYPHFIDARTGTTTKASSGKYSTIDTALLAAGTAIAARYFNAKSFSSGEGESRVFRLGGAIVGGVRWSKSIHSVKRGLIHLVFKGREEQELERIFANPFDEYAILPCIAMRGEQLAGRIGPAHELFKLHYSNADELPMKDINGQSVISKPSGNFIAHFTHLFAFYYCNTFANQASYRRELRELAAADRAHFSVTGGGKFPTSLWGLGAGSQIRFASEGLKDTKVKSIGYGVNHLNKNPNNTASPAIMAGFAPVYRSGQEGDPIPDLMRLWDTNTCRYNHEGLGFLWRCSARKPELQVEKVEAVDFSTYLLGLAGRDPAFGLAFFRHFNL